MAVTIKQIAEQAGVSRGTVDRVLHDRPGVNAQIAVHVKEIANALGYVPNRAGKFLAATRQPLTIGCMMPSINNPFFTAVVEGMRVAEAELSDFGVSVMLKEICGYDSEDHIKGIYELAKAGCQALCISTVDVPEIRRYLNELAADGIPIVAVNTDLTDTNYICYVGCNYYNNGATAAGMLSIMAKEKLNVLIATGSLKIKGHNERMQGFLQTLGDKHVPFEVIDLFETQDSVDIAYKKTKTVLAEHPEIKCIYTVAAGTAGVCRAGAEREGVR
ncbi:MAG: LacI family DNA-binding transcriptional regulator, partial [Eubacteriales bacterium]|nr:LacI family DNA-binding transcriptional regulator [Eubacteriales bacterium]